MNVGRQAYVTTLNSLFIIDTQVYDFAARRQLAHSLAHHRDEGTQEAYRVFCSKFVPRL